VGVGKKKLRNQEVYGQKLANRDYERIITSRNPNAKKKVLGLGSIGGSKNMDRVKSETNKRGQTTTREKIHPLITEDNWSRKNSSP